MFRKNSNSYNTNTNYNMILNSPKLHSTKPFNFEKILSMKFGNDILNFSKKILQLNDVNLSYFCINIENLQIQNIGSLLKEGTRAGYSVRYNSIAFKDYFDSNEVYHELLHLSSATYDRINQVEFCGFSQFNYRTNLKIGTALNEGYTEYLNEKLFNTNSNVYIIEKNLAISLEKVVGSTTMRKLFFEANLKGLIEKLMNYSTFLEIILFIESIDYVSNNADKIFSLKKIDKKLLGRMELITDYLINTYVKKLERDLKNNIISKDEYEFNLEGFANSLGSFDYYIDNKIYPLRFISERKILKKIKHAKK